MLLYIYFLQKIAHMVPAIIKREHHMIIILKIVKKVINTCKLQFGITKAGA